MRAVDAQTGQVLWEEPVRGSRSWATEWQTFTGDERALNGHTLKTASLLVPSRREFYRGMRDELADDVTRTLRSRYARD